MRLFNLFKSEEPTPDMVAGWRKSRLYILINKYHKLNNPLEITSTKVAVRIMALDSEQVEREINYYETLLNKPA